MAIAHDVTGSGRLMALLEMCEMHAARGDMRHMPGLLALIDQTRRVVREEIRQKMDAKQIDLQVRKPFKPELPI